MDPRYSKPIIRSCYYYIYEKYLNCLLGITGRVGTGKSHMAVKIASEFDTKFKLEEGLVYTVEDLINTSLRYIKYKGQPLSLEFLKSIDDVKAWLSQNVEDIYISPGRAAIFDEAGTGAYVREFFSQDNKTISKMIQIWRILRMLVIFVVPEDLSLADSTILKFINMEIKLVGIDRQKNQASCIAWEYIGWNKRNREPIKRRMRGCRYNGRLWVNPLPTELAEAYDKVSKVYKIKALVDMGRQYFMDRPVKIGETKSIWDDVKYVKEHIDEFKNAKGQVTIPMIATKLNVPHRRAQMIRTHVAIP